MQQGVSQLVTSDENPGCIHLNYFQQLMWRWSQQSAYNAIHIVEIKGECNLVSWEQAILATIKVLGLGLPQFLENGKVCFLESDHIVIQTPQSSLADYINQQLNLKFELNELPLRFFIIPQRNHYNLGITYNHWISDAYSIRLLLQQIVLRYQGQTQDLPRLILKSSSFESLYHQHFGTFSRALGLGELIYSVKLFYNAYRLTLNNKFDFHSLYVSETLSTETFTKLKAYCCQQHVSINDLFIAQLAQLMGRFSASSRYLKTRKRFRGQRDHIAISSIADIRHKANQPLDDVLGQYLSSYTVVISQPEKRSTEDILQEVHQYTRLIKQSSRLIRSLFNFKSALWFWDKHQQSQKGAVFFHKYAPICAGISNVNVRDEWLSQESGQKISVLDYWRVSPTGPLAPLVFSITTFRGQLTVCLAYRSTAVAKEIAATLCKSFCDELRRLSE